MNIGHIGINEEQLIDLPSGSCYNFKKEVQKICIDEKSFAITGKPDTEAIGGRGFIHAAFFIGKDALAAIVLLQLLRWR